MKASHQKSRSIPAMELLEEAIHLLRRMPLSSWCIYCVGTLPFLLGLLYFFADMSKGAYAPEHLSPYSLGLILLFVWMKCWQAVFAGNFRDLLTGETTPWSFRRVMGLIQVQVAFQPLALWILPISMILTLPFGWMSAFFHNLSWTGDGRNASLRDSARDAWRYACLWPVQNHAQLGIVTVFGLFVFLNLFSILALLPVLAQKFLGIENEFAQGGMSMLNTTLFALTGSLTYLCMNPLAKIVQLVRCFRGESILSGTDIRSELQGIALWKKSAALSLMLLCLSGFSAGAAETDSPMGTVPVTKKAGGEKSMSVSSGELDRAIHEVLKQPEYTWRMPREGSGKEAVDEKGFLVGFVDEIGKTLRGIITTLWDWTSGIRTVLKRWTRDFINWAKKQYDRWSPESSSSHNKDSSFDVESLQLVLFVILALTVCVLVVLLMRAWKRKRSAVETLATAVAPPPVNVADEDVQADELPEDEWRILARDLLGRGELRLALRALYLSMLAGLAQKEIIKLARHKSNLDYRREVERRLREKPELVTAFDQNRVVFERSWYGTHVVQKETWDQFSSNEERIRSL